MYVLPHIKRDLRKFLCGPVGRTHAFTAMAQDQSLIGELRSCKLHGASKRKKRERETERLFDVQDYSLIETTL